jgi:aspartate 1-decarboxylase
MDSAGIIEYEKVHILNITNGNRLDTYAIKGSRGSGCIKINGAAAHHVNVHDLIILISYCQLENHEIKSHEPKIVHVDSNNKIVSISTHEISI